MPGTLRPTAPIAADVLLPADPGLALALAQKLLERPRMANHHHGLWGYSGSRAGGGELTIQATGIGGPSAAAVAADLIERGARRLVRIGACSALPGAQAGGTIVVASAALAGDGASRALGAGATVEADSSLAAALLGAASEARPALLAGADVRDQPPASTGEATVSDLETAALFALAEQRGIAAGALLAVADAGLGDEVLEARLLALGGVASEALLEHREPVGDLVEPILDRLESP